MSAQLEQIQASSLLEPSGGITAAQRSTIDQSFVSAREMKTALLASKKKIDAMIAVKSELNTEDVAKVNKLAEEQVTLAGTYSDIAKGLNLLSNKLGLNQPNLSGWFYDTVVNVAASTQWGILFRILFTYINTNRDKAKALLTTANNVSRGLTYLKEGKITEATFQTITGASKPAEDWKVFAMKALPFVAVGIGGIFLINNVVKPYMDRPRPKAPAKRKRKA